MLHFFHKQKKYTKRIRIVIVMLLENYLIYLYTRIRKLLIIHWLMNI